MLSFSSRTTVKCELHSGRSKLVGSHKSIGKGEEGDDVREKEKESGRERRERGWKVDGEEEGEMADSRSGSHLACGSRA